ncbi:predicted protein [Histoplasma capsulatum H143]|uniref:Uncharacterized protein n=1 Tax=Ajellomyces capsulatus (strain H143) TaxID=544712 RepID=C6H8L6_AJECH|nr:predicted protein [Histoplasma capsulatum H143]
MEGSKYEIRALNARQTREEDKKSEKDDDELILRAFWEGQLAAVMHDGAEDKPVTEAENRSHDKSRGETSQIDPKNLPPEARSGTPPVALEQKALLRSSQR